MRIVELKIEPDWTLFVEADDGRLGRFDVRPHLQFEARWQVVALQNQGVPT